MTLETFFEKFDQFADAPGAVAKMRELILQCAVRGRLVRQDPNEEPASQLIRDAVRARKNLVSAKVVRDAAPDLSFIEQADHALPRGWVQAPLALYVGVIMGQSPPSSAYNESGEGLPFYQGKAQFGGLYPTATDWCTEPTKIGEPSDVVISVRAPVGPTNMLRERSCIGRGLASLRSLGGDQMHLLYTLRAFERSIAAMGVGSTFVAISKSDLDQFRLPIPPLAEQKRIVAKVDELMALCDQLEAQQREREARYAVLARAALARFADAPTPANLGLLFHRAYDVAPADLRKSILTLAVQGKLVPQDPNAEPVEELLARSLVERRKLKGTDPAAVRPLAHEDALGYDIPESWRWQRLDDLLTFGPTNGFSPKAVDYETPVRSLTLSATTSGVFKAHHSKFITTVVPADSDLWLRDGDILVQRGNTIEYVGVAAVYRGEANCFVYPDLMMKLRLSSAVDVGYVHAAMSQEVARNFLRSRASGTSGSMPKINQTTLKALPIPVPPLAEQRRIVAKVDQLMALVDELEEQLAASRATAANLLDAVVAELTDSEEAARS